VIEALARIVYTNYIDGCCARKLNLGFMAPDWEKVPQSSREHWYVIAGEVLRQMVWTTMLARSDAAPLVPAPLDWAPMVEFPLAAGGPGGPNGHSAPVTPTKEVQDPQTEAA